MRFFLYEKTFSPVLTFKNSCKGSSGRGLSQVLRKFETFDSILSPFFKFKNLHTVFEPVLVSCSHHTFFSSFCWNHSTGICVTLNYWALFLTALHSRPTWSLGRYYVLGKAHRWEEGTQNKVHTQDSSQEQASNSGNASIQQPYLAKWPVRDFFHI